MEAVFKKIRRTMYYFKNYLIHTIEIILVFLVQIQIILNRSIDNTYFIHTYFI